MSTAAATGPRVVHVTEADGAGVQTYLSLLARHAPASAAAFVLGVDGAFADELRAQGFDVRVLPMPRTTLRVGELRAARRLRALLRELDPDVVHLHSSQAGVIGRIASGRHPRWRTVYTPHAYYYLGKSGLARRVFLLAEQVLARGWPGEILTTSPSETQRAVAEIGVPAAAVTTLTNAVEVPTTTRPATSTDGPAERAPGRPFHVGLVARISPQKDVPMYLRTVAALHHRAPGTVRAHLVGVGHYAADLDTLDTMRSEAGLAAHELDVVAWMGHDALLEWLGGCDVVVLTSTYESFGYTLAEAIARGVPVVGTDVDGIRDVVEDGVNGYLVPPGDDVAMSRRILEIAGDPALYRSLSAGARTSADRLDVARWASSLEVFYREGGGGS